jgi:diadenosine tetraphosphate (Ap4A) HIT family hydrolase
MKVLLETAETFFDEMMPAKARPFLSYGLVQEVRPPFQIGGAEDGEGAGHVYAFVIGDGVPHVHVHVIGRYPGAPRRFW